MSITEYPLRKIVKKDLKFVYKTSDGLVVEKPVEILECGHKVYIKQDIYGDTNAYYRRCKKCGQF